MRVTRLFLTALAVLLLLSGPVRAQSQTRIFDLHNRPAEQLVGEIRALYPGNQVHLTSHGQQLVVRASAQDISEIARLIKRLDVPAHQLRITVRRVQDLKKHSQGGGVTISSNGVSAGAGSRTYSTARNSSHSVVVQDGQGAHVTSGSIRRVPVAVQGGRNPAAVLQSVNFTSGFVVRPQYISDHQVELHIIAFNDEPNQDSSKAQTAAVVTIRRVQPGHWVRLGGTEQQQTQEHAGTTWHAGGSKKDNTRYEVRVDVVQ